MKATKTNNYAYNGKLQPLAHNLRKDMTKAEACLWKYVLKAGKMKEYHFRRQRPVLDYIADFMCIELMLIIEVDGLSHLYEETVLKDISKQKKLEMAGYHVLHFLDHEVLNDISNVSGAIENYIMNYEREHDMKKQV
jgi:very-short-patch-repair endonuclease